MKGVLTQNRLYFGALVGLVALFVILHVSGLNIPYHQDEYKWVLYSHPELVPPGTVPHPPLTELVYGKVFGPWAGDNNFRLIPAGFGLLNLFLLFYLVKIVFDKKTALWATGLYAASFFSLLATLMVDVDGAVMPTFFLIMCIGYFKLRAKSFELGANWVWFVILVVGAVGGFLVKVSGVLPIFALALDFGIAKGFFKDKKRIIKYLFGGVLGVLVLGLILYLSKYIFPFFNLEYSFGYWKHFAVFAGRGWLQTFIQLVKALMYASPLLVLPLFFTTKEIWHKARPFFLFIFVGLAFYLFAFDFSLGALDRYLQFLVIPFCVITGAVFAKYFGSESGKLGKADIISTALISIAVFSLQFFNHFVPPHYPKTEWLERVVSLKWNFLFPFSGGSGPTGFYVSFIFIALIWLCSIIFAISALKIEGTKRRALFCILVPGILYNGVFIEEYLWGQINGSPYALFREAKSVIIENPDIRQVLVYNDVGGFEIKQTGKYFRRLYAAPQFEAEYAEIFRNFNGHILFINIPQVAKNSLYQNYFEKYCKSIFDKTDRYITAQILACRAAK